ncbi:MAG TPA: sulfatase-like hydrolase/transferase [Ohtaekwangia sp.]
MTRLFQGLRFQGNIYKGLLLQLLIAMLLFSLCRVGFFLFNLSYFPNMTLINFLKIMAGGMRFDLTAVLYTNALFILLTIIPFEFRFAKWYQTILKWIFFITNGIALAANISDFVYYRFTGRRTTADVFQQFEHEQNLTKLWLRFAWDYWYGVLIVVLLIALMVWLYRKVKVEGPQLTNRIVFYISGVILIPAVLYLFIIGVRGGAYHHIRPITLNDAGQYVDDPRDIVLVLNTPFAIYRTLGKTKIKRVTFFKDQNEVDSLFSPIRNSVDTGQMKKLNVVIIILESFSKEFVGYYNHHRENGKYKGYAPFMDSLLQYSRAYRYSFANGRKSIDALPSVIASIPSMGVPYVLSPFSGNKVNSLGSLLGAEGYETAFLHGAPNGSMGFEAFMNVAGIEKYYGMDEYGNDDDFDGWWGIWDEPFLQYVAGVQTDFEEPFFSVTFTLSSHHPYIVPPEYEGKFKGGPVPILRGIQYTDNALRKYFQRVSKEPWYKNTLFVISADHVSSNVLFTDGRTAPGLFAIPIFFFRPDNSLAGMDDQTIVQQVDIMPTVLGYLNYRKPYVAFGQDVFKNAGQSCAWNYEAGVFQYYEGDYLMQFDGKRSIALYNFKTDSLQQENLLEKNPSMSKHLEKRLKAVIQQYNNRMVDNDLILTETKPANAGH